MKDVIIELIAKETLLNDGEVENLVEVPPRSEMGDFAFPCFELAKLEKKSPVEIARGMAGKFMVNLPKEIERVDVDGAYVNFFVDKKILAGEVLGRVCRAKGRLFVLTCLVRILRSRLGLGI